MHKLSTKAQRRPLLSHLKAAASFHALKASKLIASHGGTVGVGGDNGVGGRAAGKGAS
jgi:hypothetical protein